MRTRSPSGLGDGRGGLAGPFERGGVDGGDVLDAAAMRGGDGLGLCLARRRRGAGPGPDRAGSSRWWASDRGARAAPGSVSGGGRACHAAAQPIGDAHRTLRRTRGRPLERRSPREVTACRACPRLVAWREQVARRASGPRSADETYWGRPCPASAIRRPRVVVVGLAPAAHGANRTGRMFTGDRSGDLLYARAAPGRLRQPAHESMHRDDGLALTGAWITAPVRCAPPANKPTPAERDTCRPFLDRELALLDGCGCSSRSVRSASTPRARVLACAPGPRSATASRWRSPDGRTILGSYHVSQQNTFTGRLTEPMLDAVFAPGPRAGRNPLNSGRIGRSSAVLVRMASPPRAPVVPKKAA